MISVTKILVISDFPQTWPEKMMDKIQLWAIRLLLDYPPIGTKGPKKNKSWSDIDNKVIIDNIYL